MIAFTLSSREYARELTKLQSGDNRKKKSLSTSRKGEEMGSTLTEATASVTYSTSYSNITMAAVDAAAAGSTGTDSYY